MTQGDKTPSRRRLHADLTLMHEEGACLPLRSTHGQCHACADVCPVQALRVTVAAVELSDACTGCGRCTAACPTQALALPEMAILAVAVPPVTGAMTLRVECRKVPPQAHSDETLVLPCLGALTSGHLLARAAAGIEVQIVDRGWCHGCEAGCSEARPEHPASRAVEAAALWLDAVGSVRRASLVHEPLPLALRPAAIPPAPLPAPALDRRRFFRAALERPAGRQPSDATPMGGDGRAGYPVDARQPSPERERERLALERLAQDHGTAMPAEFFPQLHADARCCDRRMCVALCPTAALSVADDGAAAHLQWSSERCIACGTCVRACPDAALHLSPHGGMAGTHSLASHLRTRCSSCGDAFTPNDAQANAAEPARCPACSKSLHFMHDARRQLFGALN